MIPKTYTFILDIPGRPGPQVTQFAVKPSYDDMVETIAKHVNASQEQITMTVPVRCGDERYDSTITSDSWPECLEAARGAVAVNVGEAPARRERSKAHPSSSMRIFVKTLTGRTRPIKVRPSDTIYRVKSVIQDHEGIPPCQQRLVFNGTSMEDDNTVRDYHLRPDSTINLLLMLRGGKPVIYVMPPTPMNVSVKLSLVPEWSFSAIYPPTPITAEGGERIEWQVTAQPDGSLNCKGTEVPYLFWEVADHSSNPTTNEHGGSPPDHTLAHDHFNPAQPQLSPENAIVLPKAAVPSYLERELATLGLNSTARTDFITYWLGDINRHSHVALRFLPQDVYSKTAPLETTPPPEAVTRVFMLFGGVEEGELHQTWAQAVERGQGGVDWAGVVGIDPRMHDSGLLRVLEWGGMEVM